MWICCLYIYIYMCVCGAVAKCSPWLEVSQWLIYKMLELFKFAQQFL